jgi:hypothetical protein
MCLRDFGVSDFFFGGGGGIFEQHFGICNILFFVTLEIQ